MIKVDSLNQHMLGIHIELEKGAPWRVITLMEINGQIQGTIWFDYLEVYRLSLMRSDQLIEWYHHLRDRVNTIVLKHDDNISRFVEASNTCSIQILPPPTTQS